MAAKRKTTFLKLRCRAADCPRIDAQERAKIEAFDAGWYAYTQVGELPKGSGPVEVAGFCAAQAAWTARHFATNGTAL